MSTGDLSIYERRQRAKDEAEKYRSIARSLTLAELTPDQRQCGLQTPDHANVVVLEGGAFVDAVLWIPEGNIK